MHGIYGNALIGRYVGCFEEGYNEAYDDRAYRAKGLDAPAKYAPTLEVRKGMHGAEEARKIWLVEVSTIEYSHYSEELMHLLSVTLNLIRRFTKRQVPRGGVYGGLVILAHPQLMVRESTLIFEPSRG